MAKRRRSMIQTTTGKAGKALLFPSKTGNPVITLITDQGHKFPAEAPPLIVKFFKEQAMAESHESGRKK